MLSHTHTHIHQHVSLARCCIAIHTQCRFIFKTISTANKLTCRYGVAYGAVHFVFMSTEHVFWKGSRQYRWLKNYMETKVDRSLTPWLVFIGHR